MGLTASSSTLALLGLRQQLGRQLLACQPARFSWTWRRLLALARLVTGLGEVRIMPLLLLAQVALWFE